MLTTGRAVEHAAEGIRNIDTIMVGIAWSGSGRRACGQAGTASGSGSWMCSPSATGPSKGFPRRHRLMYLADSPMTTTMVLRAPIRCATQWAKLSHTSMPRVAERPVRVLDRLIGHQTAALGESLPDHGHRQRGAGHHAQAGASQGIDSPGQPPETIAGARHRHPEDGSERSPFGAIQSHSLRVVPRPLQQATFMLSHVASYHLLARPDAARAMPRHQRREDAYLPHAAGPGQENHRRSRAAPHGRWAHRDRLPVATEAPATAASPPSPSPPPR